MDGLLVIDKPVGPTSHDVVARVRRLLKERRIGHTGTLDPLASGVLPLVIGRATRLARFYSASEKRYEAVLRLGIATDTGDAQGRPVGPAFDGPWPSSEAIESALERFRGEFLQQPPAYSAKKIDGQRSYALARARGRDARAGEPAEPVAVPAAVPVATSALRLLSAAGDTLTLDVTCSPGFYVRSLAHDLGAALGTGGHLTALRRTASGAIDLSAASPLDLLEGRDGAERAAGALRPMDDLLPHLPAMTLTPEGVRRVSQGQDVGPAHAEGAAPPSGGVVRLRSAAGQLVAIAEPTERPGILHPAIVLI